MTNNNASKIADLALAFRRVLDKCERATDQPVPWQEIQAGRELIRVVMLISDQMQAEEDDGK